MDGYNTRERQVSRPGPGNPFSPSSIRPLGAASATRTSTHRELAPPHFVERTAESISLSPPPEVTTGTMPGTTTPGQPIPGHYPRPQSAQSSSFAQNHTRQSSRSFNSTHLASTPPHAKQARVPISQMNAKSLGNCLPCAILGVEVSLDLFLFGYLQKSC